ncbi:MULTISPECIES: translocation and assembly module lipoprotein TamL [Niastella]|uniref:BamA/TamA family outer membrane protein n=1 Tax=Niastella soli TaxID=2821487 RepID=A0ABS3YN94_9BACT|nr:BamA/TamA family outer membrane protein [Niastella soli]MBO9199288.1 BamA/TamA family outer membrane protein [Niastella soli]
MKIVSYIYLLLLVLCLVLLGACSSTKVVPAGDALYTGAKIDIRDSLLTRKKKKALSSQLLALTRPKPNQKVLGIPFKLNIYNAFRAKKGLGKWIREKMGQPPVLLSNVNLNKNVQVLQNYLVNKGYFNARVRGDSTIKGKKASATYSVRADGQYIIQKVEFRGDSSTLQQAIRGTMPKTLLKKDKPFDLEVITTERLRIDNYLKENGFYFFSPENLLIKADTTIGHNKVDLFMTVKPDIPDNAQKVYRINDVYIFTGYNLDAAQMDTSRAGATLYKGYYVVDRRKFYKPKLFQQAMAFDSGDVYNRTDHNASISRLVSMDIFKFVKNRFEVVPNVDSPLLNTYYYLTRQPKKSLRAELNGYTKSNNLTGSNITLGWRNRNAFRGGEILAVKASAGFEVQYSGQFKGYNTFRFGLEPSISFPRFLVPFFNFNTKGGFLPRTNIKLGYDILQRQKLYTMNSFRVSYGFTWKESIQKEHELNPIVINYVQPVSITQEYLDSAKNNTALYSAIDTQFILGSEYSYTWTNVVTYKPVNGFYLNAGIDISGNVAGLLTGANISKGDTGYVIGKQFSQFTRLVGDFRFYRKVASNSVWANRIYAGIGIPYGNSSALPYVKQFFSGGNNSLRAFRSRSVGPGTFEAPQQNGTFQEQPGDIKLEMNTELRFPLVSILQGAVFVDAGNVWLWNDDKYRPGAQFTSKFLSEIAAGTGVGIRFDLSFLVLRFDLAFPIRKPWLEPGKRWVLNQVDFGSSEWRKDNLIFNLAIGYPF